MYRFGGDALKDGRKFKRSAVHQRKTGAFIQFPLHLNTHTSAPLLKPPVHAASQSTICRLNKQAHIQSHLNTTRVPSYPHRRLRLKINAPRRAEAPTHHTRGDTQLPKNLGTEYKNWASRKGSPEYSR